MAEKKITKRENFEGIMNFLAENGKTEWAKVMEHEIDLLTRKGSKSATATLAQKDAAAIAEIIRDILAECENSKGMTVGAILKDARITSYERAGKNKDINSQVVTSILTKNPKDFIRTEEKKVAYYALSYGVEGEGA